MPIESALFVDSNECHPSEKTEPVQPPEIFCQILHLAVGRDGIKALLPFTNVSARWRRAALGDSSLWTTIYVKQTPTLLLDMILARAGDQLFTVYVDDPDVDRLAKLWKLVDRIEELHYSTEPGRLAPFLSSLGPAPNLKVLHLRPWLTAGTGGTESSLCLPTIFSGCLPSLRSLVLTETIFWPAGIFKGLTSFECGDREMYPLSPVHLLGVLRESPSLESLRLTGICNHPKGSRQSIAPLTVALPSLRKCILTGEGTTALMLFMTVPPSAVVFLSKSYISFGIVSPKSNLFATSPGLAILDEVSAVSFSLDDTAVRLRARNDHGGVFDSEERELDSFSRDPARFVPFIRSSLECGRTCPGFKSARVFTLDIKRERIWLPEESASFARDLMRFLSNLPGVEEVKLQGVPLRELSIIFEALGGPPGSQLPCKNLKRLHVESTPLRSPRSLLAGLDGLLSGRRNAGAPIQSIAVKVKCEMPIPVAGHHAVLTSWEGLVGGGARLEYERTEVKKLPRCRRRDYLEDDDEWDDVDEDNDKGYEEEDEVASTGDSGDCNHGWDGWPERWPETLEEMGGQ